MDIRNKLKTLEDHFVIIWTLLAIVGYVVLSFFGLLDFRQYVLFLVIVITIYAVLKDHYIFWFFFLSYILYLLLIRANFIHSPTIAQIDGVFTKSAHDIVAMIGNAVK